jgi:AraC-like DNA-binding protein
MSKIWRLQRIRDELLLDLINHPNITIDELVNRYNTSKTKLYEYFREEYDTTPGRWRKTYWRGVHWAARFYRSAFVVSVCSDFQDQRVTDECYIDRLFHVEDTPMTYSVVQVEARIGDRSYAFSTNQRIQVDEWSNIHSTQGNYTLSIRLKRGGQRPMVTAFLSLGSHHGGQISMPYELTVTVLTRLVGYDNSVLSSPPETLPVPEPLTMVPMTSGADFDLATRSVYLLHLGRQILLLGMYEAVSLAAVKRLNSRWQGVPLNNALRRKLRTAFHTGEYIEISLREALEMQDRVVTVMNQYDGIPVCLFEINNTRYLVSLEEQPDLSDLAVLYPYLESAPTRVAKETVREVARSHGAVCASLQDLTNVMRT